MASFKMITRFVIVVSALAMMAAAAQARQAPIPGTPAERLTLDGVENFARIDGFLYRGAQPKPFAFEELKNAGIGVVVDFRDEKEEINDEQKRVEAVGMQFVSLPWKGTGEPTHAEVLSFLNLMHDMRGKKVFVHCRRGADRTGVMVALYRMTFDHWGADQAVDEMKEFHYASFLLSHLAGFVRAYPTQLASDPTLRSLMVAAAATSIP
jgi:protein tyrosine/serine phosphatase